MPPSDWEKIKKKKKKQCKKVLKNQNDGQAKVIDIGELPITNLYWIKWIVKTIKIQSGGCTWFLHSMLFHFKEWHSHTHQKYKKEENGDEMEMRVRGFVEETKTFREAKSRAWGFYTGYQRLVFNQIQSLGLNQSQIQMLPILYQNFIRSMSFLSKSFHWSYP